MFKNFVLFLPLFILSACSSTIVEEQEHFSWTEYKTKNIENYESHYSYKNSPLHKRHLKLPAKLATDITKTVAYDWFQLNAKPIEDEDPVYQEFEKAMNELPAAIKLMMEKKVVFWTVVEDLGSSGLTWPLYNEKNFLDKGIIVFNKNTVGKPFKEICEKRENSPYQSGPIKFLCSFTKSSVNAIQYIALHEFGHILQSNNSFIPDFEAKLTDERSLNWFPLTKISWKWDGKNDAITRDPIFSNWIKERKYYALEKKLNNEILEDHYNHWKTSKFPSIYSTVHHHEEWAEITALILLKKYFHTELIYSLSKNNKITSSVKSCLFNEICPEKLKLAEMYLDNQDLFNID
jgi:hypothetical protein